MAVPSVSQRSSGLAGGAAQWAAWSGYITWALIALVAVLVLTIAGVLITHYIKESKRGQLRGTWDEVYQALADKPPTPRARIPALESLWDRVSGTPAQPYVAMDLAQAHFEMARDTEREAAERRQSLKKAGAIFDLVRKEWPNHPAYGALACEGAALCCEEEGDLDGAIQILKPALDQYEKHFLYTKLQYELGRIYWRRALTKEAAGRDSSEDRKEAKALLDRAVEQEMRALAQTRDARLDTLDWRNEARFLKSLLDKPGPAMKVFPNGVPPTTSGTGVQKEAHETPGAAPAVKKAEAAPPAKPEAPKAEVPKAPEEKKQSPPPAEGKK